MNESSGHEGLVLIFDGACGKCSRLAAVIQRAVSVSIELLNIHDRRAVDLLNTVHPGGWAFKPYLIGTVGDRYRSYSGPRLALRLFSLMGLRRSIDVWQAIRSKDQPLHHPAAGIGRRRFLAQAGALFAAVVIGLRFNVREVSACMKCCNDATPEFVGIVCQDYCNPGWDTYERYDYYDNCCGQYCYTRWYLDYPYCNCF